MTRFNKITSCFFLLLMLMNTMGYYTFWVLVKDKAIADTAHKIRSNENEPGANLIITLPLSLPYGSPDSEGYELASGHFTFDGKVYQTIKQKIYHDTLFVVCIHDPTTTEADSQIKDLAKTFADDKKESDAGLKVLSSLAKYYLQFDMRLQSLSLGWTIEYLFEDAADKRTADLSRTTFRPPRV